MSSLTDRIPVYAGDQLIEMCDPERARVLGRAGNVSIIRRRRGGEIARVNILPLGTKACGGAAAGGSSQPYYREELAANPQLPMLKRPIGGPADGYVRW